MATKQPPARKDAQLKIEPPPKVDSHPASKTATKRFTAQALVPPVLLCGVYLVFALYGFRRTFPPGLNHDAAWHGLYAFKILSGAPFSIYTPEAYGHETPYYYVMAAFFRLFGASKETIELTATFFGLLSVFLFYAVLLTVTRNRWVAFGCGLLWVSSSALILYSRVGWQLITLIPAALLVAGAVRLYQIEPSKHRRWAAAVGAACAITLYTYNGGRAIVFFLVVFWLVQLGLALARRRKNPAEQPVAQRLQDAGISLASFAIVAAPMLWYAAFNWEAWNGRATALLAGGGASSKLQNLLAALGYFNVSARGNDFFTDFSVLEGPMLLLWLSGMFFSVVRLRIYWPELLLFGTFLLPGVVTQPSFHRSVGTLPIVYLLTSYFLIGVGCCAREGLRARGMKHATHALAAAFALLIVVQLGAGWKKLYIDKQPFLWGFYPETTVVGQYLHKNPDKRYVIYAGNWPQDALTFLATTDPARPGANFVNYQGYNTASQDGLTEIMNDLESGAIARPVHFIVDPAKANFMRASLQPRYKVQGQGVLKNDDGVEVAQLYLVE